jgi:hypothetical protein
MAYYKIPLKAGVEYRQDVIGSIILVDAIDGAAGVDITPMRNGTPQRTMPDRRVAFKYHTGFDAVILKAAVDCTVSIFLTDSDVSLGFTDGSQVNVLGSVSVSNGVDQRVPVDLAGGTVTVSADNVGINNTDANAVPVVQKANTKFATIVYQAQAVTDVAAVAVTAVRAALVAADANRRGLRIRNVGANAVAIGGAALTYAGAAVILQPGETWNESEAPGAAWYCVCDAGMASNLNLQTIA